MVKWLDRGLLTGPCFALCLTEKQWHYVCRRSKFPTPYPAHVGAGKDACTHLFESKSGNGVAVVCLASMKGKSLEQVYALLVHEAMHIWQRYLRDIGETAPGDELEAYSVQRITYELFAEYRRQTRRGKSS